MEQMGQEALRVGVFAVQAVADGRIGFVAQRGQRSGFATFGSGLDNGQAMIACFEQALCQSRPVEGILLRPQRRELGAND